MGKDLRKRASKNRSAVASLDRERASQRALMARKRAAGRDIIIPSICNPRRRRRCEKDPALFLKTYFPHIFTTPFTSDHRSMIDAFVNRIHYGGWKAEASPRGGGKTSIIRGLAMDAIVYGLRRFPVIIAANATHADMNLINIRVEFEKNNLLAEDFPEICIPIRALAGANQRAAAQTVAGQRTYLKWTGNLIQMPTVVGSAASGAIITSVGIEGAIRGLNYQGQRPDLVLIDDCETRESANSEIETRKREEIIDSDIIGLAGQEKRIAIFYTCTIWSANCLAAKYTDPKIKPAWAGSRRKLLDQKPEREDLWIKYMEMRQAGVITGDETGRAAHRFYLSHRRQMDKASVVSNPYRFDSTILPDGSQIQVSALQFCYDQVADTDWSHFNTEYQNEPPAGAAVEMIEVTTQAVMKRCNGLDRGTVVSEVDYLTAGLDIGARAIHWTVTAWKNSAGSVIDYGAIPVHSPIAGGVEDPENVAAVHEAILTALCEFRDMADAGWSDAETGELMLLDIAMVDVGYARSSMDTPVYEFIRSSSGNVYRACKGFGTGSGQSRYRHPTSRGHGRRLGNHWFSTWQPGHMTRLYNADADYWKNFVHTGLLTGHNRPGSLTLFGRAAEAVAHRQYARQITAEVWTREYKPGKGDVWLWKRIRQQNHWFDTTYLACVAASIAGMKTIGAAASAAAAKSKGKRRPKTPKIRLSDLQRRKRLKG